MILHTVLPLEEVLRKNDGESGRCLNVAGSYYHTAKGGELVRIESTDPKIYLSSRYRLGAKYRGKKTRPGLF